MKAETLKRICKEFNIKRSEYDKVLVSLSKDRTSALISFGIAMFSNSRWRIDWQKEFTKKIESEADAAEFEPYCGAEDIRYIMRHNH